MEAPHPPHAPILTFYGLFKLQAGSFAGAWDAPETFAARKRPEEGAWDGEEAVVGGACCSFTVFSERLALSVVYLGVWLSRMYLVCC